MAVWLQVKVCGRGLSLYAHPVCDTKAPLQLQLGLVALYKCYMPLPYKYAFVGPNNWQTHWSVTLPTGHYVDWFEFAVMSECDTSLNIVLTVIVMTEIRICYVK